MRCHPMVSIHSVEGLIYIILISHLDEPYGMLILKFL